MLRYNFYPKNPELVVLDTGMVTQMPVSDRDDLKNFFVGLTTQNGALMGRSIVRLSEGCKADGKFIDSVEELFRGVSAADVRDNSERIIADMYRCLREFKVTLKREVSVVVVSTMILEGWACDLDPDVRIIPEIQRSLDKGTGSMWGMLCGLPEELQMTQMGACWAY